MASSERPLQSLVTSSTRSRRSSIETGQYWPTTVTPEPISEHLRELVREDLQNAWHMFRLERFRQDIKTNWMTDDDHMVVLDDENGTLTRNRFKSSCMILTYLQTLVSR